MRWRFIEKKLVEKDLITMMSGVKSKTRLRRVYPGTVIPVFTISKSLENYTLQNILWKRIK